jgi:hypothetical protein
LAATVAVNMAVVPSAATESEAGTVTDAVLLESAIVPPPDFDMVTVQVVDWDGATLVGLQVSAVTINGPTSDSDADRETPFTVAEIRTAWSLVRTPTVAVNVADTLPAGTATDAGTVTDALLLERATIPPAVLESVTVHVVDELLVKVAAVQLRPLIVTAVVNATEADLEDPFKAAVIVAFWSDEIVPAVTENVVVVFPLATETEPGAVSSPLLLDSDTVPPRVFVSVTVQALVPPAPKVAGAHATELIAGGDVREIWVDRNDPFNDPVIVTIWSLEMTPAVAVNVAVVAPAATETDAGTVANALLLESATVPPPVRDRVTVHVLAVPELKEDGAQLKPVTFGTAADVTVPPVPVSARDCPSGDAAMVSAIPSMTVLDADGDSVTVMEATTPFCIVFAFNPATMHL